MDRPRTRVGDVEDAVTCGDVVEEAGPGHLNHSVAAVCRVDGPQIGAVGGVEHTIEQGEAEEVAVGFHHTGLQHMAVAVEARDEARGIQGTARGVEGLAEARDVPGVRGGIPHGALREDNVSGSLLDDKLRRRIGA